jgi:hypothetical protein
MGLQTSWRRYTICANAGPVDGAPAPLTALMRLGTRRSALLRQAEKMADQDA